MRHGFIVSAVLLISVTGFTADNLDPIRPAMEQALARVKPALVRVEVVWVDYAQGREIKHEASGSGFIIGKKGYVVTNHHVAGHATRAVCVFANNEEIEATLVGTDPMTDIAVLKLDDSHHLEYPTVEWGDSSLATVGDTVLAMGSPLALSQSVTRGIISNAKMVMPGHYRRAGGFTLEGEDVGALVRWIAHDAPIYPGNSGGPLVNLNGEVIGVNEISLGLGGAIPSNLARDVAQQLIAQGQVTRSWLGLEIQPLLKASGQTNGVLISGVLDDSPAEQAGLKPNDVLLRLAGKDVNVRFDEELPLLNLMITGLPIGQDVEAVVLRAGHETSLKIRPTTREPIDFKREELKPWGMTARNISALTARELKLPDRNGVLVTTIRPGGPCADAKPSIQPLDIVTHVAGKSVTNVATLVAATEELTKGHAEPVPTTVQFSRKTEDFLTIVRVGIKDLEDPGLEARKAWLPVAVQAITREMADQLGSKSLTGVRITQVYTNSSAEAAGLRIGDLIIQIDGEKIPASQPGDEEVFTSRIRQYRVGARPELRIQRDGQSSTLTVELVRAPKLEREMKKFQDNNFEFTVRDLCFFDRVRDDLPENLPGVIVTDVKDGGWAALGQLSANDIVQSVNAEPVPDVLAFERLMKNMPQQKPKFVVLKVQRGIHTRYLELEPNWEKPTP